jgi:hypothetical protein
MSFRPAKRAATREGLRIPRAPKTLDDAVRLASWAAVQIARGNISHHDARAITDALKEFRELLGVRDARAEAEALRRQIAELRERTGEAARA